MGAGVRPAPYVLGLLPLGCAAHHLLDLALGRSTWNGTFAQRLLGLLFFPGGAFGFLSLFFA